MSTIKVLSNHYTPETSYLVENYPYGFVLRCQIRYWLEVNAKGTRFWSQTTNPKKGNTWNKPKASTYCPVGAMYLDEKNHVQWSGLSPYDSSKAKEWLETYRAGLTEKQIQFCEAWIKLHEKREAAKEPITNDDYGPSKPIA
jgi:hypothetical protein